MVHTPWTLVSHPSSWITLTEKAFTRDILLSGHNSQVPILTTVPTDTLRRQNTIYGIPSLTCGKQYGHVSREPEYIIFTTLFPRCMESLFTGTLWTGNE